jgi:hypothetical protein
MPHILRKRHHRSGLNAPQGAGSRGSTGPKRVGIVHEHDITRRGIVEALAEDSLLAVMFSVDDLPPKAVVDVVVVSPRAARLHQFDCPLVICLGEQGDAIAGPAGNKVRAILSCGATRADQLAAAVRAVAVGLKVETA